MKYEKPEITMAYSALIVVQSGMKGPYALVDSIPLQSNGAYEADE